MEWLLSPTIVFCLGGTGRAIGERLAGILAENYSSSPLTVWAVDQHENEYALTPLLTHAKPVAQFPGPLDQVVADAIAASLSLEDCRITMSVEAPVNLRLSLLAAPGEIQSSFLSELATHLHISAKRHCGAGYLVEGFFILPELATPSAGNAEALQELFDRIEAPASDRNSTSALFSYCWWLGRINTRGLALPPFPSSAGEITSVVLGVLTTPLQQLPASITLLSGRSQHMSVGHAELFVSREKLFQYLRSCYTGQLIKSGFLDRRSCVDEQAVQKFVWEFAQSAECAGLLSEVDLTPGGDRIWKGFHVEIPAEVCDGDLDNFMASIHGASRKFFSELKELRKEFELSGRFRRVTFLTQLETKVQELVEHSRGGLFETRAFLDEMQSLLLETVEIAEGEKATNLQEIRREFDRAFAETIQLQASPSAREHEAKVKELRRQLDRLTRLRNIFAPPALDAAIVDVLSWRGIDEADATLDDGIATILSQLQTEVIAWAQATAGTEHVLQYARYEVAPEIARREDAIKKAEERLYTSAAECRNLRLELELVRNGLRWKWFPSTWHERSLRNKNERLEHLQNVLLQQQAREVINTHASRMQLSIDWIIYDVRSKLIHSALDQVRLLHRKISHAIETLNGISDSCASMDPALNEHLLRKSFLSESDLETLLENLTKSLPAVSLDGCPSAWEICCQSAEKTAAQLKEIAGKRFMAILDWTIDDFLRVLKTPNHRLETLIAWLQNASQPLFPHPDERTFEYALIRASENSDVARIVRHTLPEAIWFEPTASSSISVLQLRHLPVSKHSPAEIHVPLGPHTDESDCHKN